MEKPQKLLLMLLAFIPTEVLADWAINEETNTPTVFSHQGSGYSHANIFKSPNGTKQVYIWVRPTNSEYCRAQGEVNGNSGYVVKSRIIVNDTLVHVKKFIEPTPNGCYVYFAGKSPEDKKTLISEFMKSSDVFVEIDAADNGFASKYRGKQLKVAGATNVEGKQFSLQLVKDSHGNEHSFVTVATSEVRWYRFKTKNFQKFWSN